MFAGLARPYIHERSLGTAFKQQGFNVQGFQEFIFNLHCRFDRSSFDYILQIIDNYDFPVVKTLGQVGARWSSGLPIALKGASTSRPGSADFPLL